MDSSEAVNFPTSREWTIPASDRPPQRVAIIMRTKDRPVLLPRAFKSVLLQVHQDWHLYVVNDGGDPGSVDRCVSDYAADFGDRVTIIHNSSSAGMEAASNIGLSKAEGDFLVVHDDDDTWHPEFLKETVAFLSQKRNARFVAVAARPILVHERIEGEAVIEERREEWDAWIPMMDMAHLICRNAFPPICLLIRMDAVRAVGTYNTDMPVLGDWDYNLRLLCLGDIGTLEQRLAAYHHRSRADVQYGNSVTAGVDNHKIYDTLYRNSIMRTALKDPATLGLLHAILRMMEEHRNALRRQLVEQDTIILRNVNERFDRLEAKLAINQENLREIVRSVLSETQR
jgi:glycosyltransferase involved in cell wall biosynthesis